MADRFLIIGAAGLVGRHLVEALRGADVVATYREGTPGEQKLDITDTDAVKRVINGWRPDVVMLAAAEAYVERCEREPLETRRVNVEAARVVASSAHEVGARLVVFSSEYVFDGSAGSYDEEDERNPINEYGRQKVLLEEIALETGRGLVCRTSGVFGDDPRRKNFVCQLIDRLRNGETFDVPSDQLVTPTYAPDLARAVVKLVEHDQIGIYHVAGPEITTRVDFARSVVDAFGLDPSLLRPRQTKELGLAAARPERAGLRTEKLRRHLGEGLASPTNALRDLAS